jgi:C-terminal processing protease CtpA/Prc
MNQNLTSRYEREHNMEGEKVLEYKILNDSIAYMGIHSFSNDDIQEYTEEKKLSIFLKNSFKSIAENQIKTLIVDVSENTGGSEGNEGLLYSYFGENYQKYEKVRAKTQKAIIDNGTDKPISLKAFGIVERLLFNKKVEDGTIERRASVGKGLMAYKKEPEFKFSGKTYVLISPVTYSGGSEFSNMMYSQGLATFVGQETGGGYYGNTSGYGRRLILPHSKIEVSIPALQFVMNVNPSLPFGRGVIPHHVAIPTFEEYVAGENAALNFVLQQLEK